MVCFLPLLSTSTFFPSSNHLLLLITLHLLANGDGRLHPEIDKCISLSTLQPITQTIPLLLGDLIDFAADQIQVGVDGLLVRLVHLWQREQRNVRCKLKEQIAIKSPSLSPSNLPLTQDDQGHSVEPGTDVRQAPEHQTKLDRIDKVLDEEQATQLSQHGIDMRDGDSRHLLHLLLRQLQLKVHEGPERGEWGIRKSSTKVTKVAACSLEGVTLGGLLDGLHHALVYPEGDGADQRKQRGVGKHRNHREAGHGQQDHHTSAAHDSRLLHIAPVNEGLHCRW